MFLNRILLLIFFMCFPEKNICPSENTWLRSVCEREVCYVKFTESLKKNREFKRVYSKGKSIANRLLVMYVLPNDMGHNRLGISVSKKVGNSVVRSKVTRRIRESYRLAESKPEMGNDIIIIARTSASTSTYAGVDKALRQLLKKQGMGGA